MTGSKPLDRILALITFVIVCVAYVVWPTTGRVYDLSKQDVRANLRKMTTPVVFTGPKLRLKDEQADRMNWALEEQGGPPVLVSAALSTEKNGNATRVVVSVTPPALASGGPNAIQRVAIQKLFLSTMIEQIDATLTRREFVWMKVAPEMFIAMAVSMTAISKQMERAGEASVAQDRRNIERAYEAEARGERPAGR